ncbi:MAG: hypothetical protein AB1626_01645 [Candidatus Micrarchaeota archaeon]
MSEGFIGLNTFLAAAVAIALLAEFGDLTLAAVALCGLFVLTLRADELLAKVWENIMGITNFLTLKW